MTRSGIAFCIVTLGLLGINDVNPPDRRKVTCLSNLFLLVAFYVYILQSSVDGSYYKGYTEDYIQRLSQHNSGQSIYTSKKMLWKLVYVEVLDTRATAMRREKNLKKATRERIEALIDSQKNILKGVAEINPPQDCGD